MRIATHPNHLAQDFAHGTSPSKRVTIYPEHAKPLNGYNGGYSSDSTGIGLSPVPGVLSTLSARPGSGAPKIGALAQPATPNAIPEPGTTLSIFA